MDLLEGLELGTRLQDSHMFSENWKFENSRDLVIRAGPEPDRSVK